MHHLWVKIDFLMFCFDGTAKGVESQALALTPPSSHDGIMVQPARACPNGMSSNPGPRLCNFIMIGF